MQKQFFKNYFKEIVRRHFQIGISTKMFLTKQKIFGVKKWNWYFSRYFFTSKDPQCCSIKARMLLNTWSNKIEKNTTKCCGEFWINTDFSFNFLYLQLKIKTWFTLASTKSNVNQIQMKLCDTYMFILT